MNKLREEFIECFMWSSKDDGWKLLPRRTPGKIFNWINQNYISKEQILNLECLKEEKITKNIFSITQLESRNKIRNQIKNEIKKL